jgi:hypothetical protein
MRWRRDQRRGPDSGSAEVAASRVLVSGTKLL